MIRTEAGGFELKHTFVVGPSSFSATQPCRLKDRSWQLTRTLFPNFSSNWRTSGSMPEKSSFCGNRRRSVQLLSCRRDIWSGIWSIAGVKTDCGARVFACSRVLPACQGPKWRVSGELHSSFLTQYLWQSVKQRKKRNSTPPKQCTPDIHRQFMYSVQPVQCEFTSTFFFIVSYFYPLHFLFCMILFIFILRTKRLIHYKM